MAMVSWSLMAKTRTRKAPTRDERKARTRAELLDAAERLFVRDGFHATSVDAVADEARYTKGAVYSNFDSKEDLFLAVYERRVERAIPEMEAALAAADDPAGGIERLAGEAAARRAEEDGWLAVFFEFWAHALRDPELRERFATQHARFLEPLVAATAQAFAGRGVEPYEEPRKLTTAWNAMQLGLLLERLTQPEVVDEKLAVRMMRIAFEQGRGDGPGRLPR
jgi:AcrR family transcriptional regulator